MSPLAPQIPANMKDVLIRAPRWSLQYRPSLVSGRNKKNEFQRIKNQAQEQRNK